MALAWGCGGDPATETTPDAASEIALEVLPEVVPADSDDTSDTPSGPTLVEGRVKLAWPLQGPVVGARVSLLEDPSQVAITDESGAFTLALPNAGRGALLVEADGYMDAMLLIVDYRDTPSFTIAIELFEEGQLATIYESFVVGSTLTPLPGRAHVRLLLVHPEPTVDWASGATVQGAEPTHYAPWPPVAPPAPLVSVTAAGAYVANLEPTGSYSMTARSGFDTECVGPSANGYAATFEVPLRADTVISTYVMCPLPVDKVPVLGRLQDDLTGQLLAAAKVCEWQADADSDNCAITDAAGYFGLLVDVAPRVAVRVEAAGTTPLVVPLTRFEGQGFHLYDPMWSPTREDFAADSAMFAERAGASPPSPTTISQLELHVMMRDQRVTLDPASGSGMVLGSELWGVDYEGALGTVLFPNVVPDDSASDGFFRVRFETPLRASCTNAWFEDPSTLLVPAQAGHITRLGTFTCD